MEDRKKIIRIASRESRLAVIQAELVRERILKSDPGIRSVIVTMKTTGDRIQDRTLDKIGGKGLFVRELDEALREFRADISVHSLKDMPKDIPEDLPLLAYSDREDPRDVLILPAGASEIDPSLPVGTSSLRRALQIKELYPGIETAPVRGNVETRIRKLDEGQYSALILAAAGVKRLGLKHRISRYFGPEEMLPAPCQGILGIQGRAEEDHDYLRSVDSAESRIAAMAERAFIRETGADCGSPDTAFAWISGDTVNITGMRYDPVSDRLIKANLSGPVSDAARLGAELARKIEAEITGTAYIPPAGKVWLVGAGPGDAALLTVKGREVLSRADVVVYDALIGGGILSCAPDSAEMIYAGKRSGNHALKQSEINRLLLDKALEGKNVVRLKGGDPFVFGRGGEELELLRENGIPYEIVPGVTSAFAVPAYAGIPVTHRDFCSSVHVITGHRRKDNTHNIDFVALTEGGGTLVFLMGVSSLPVIANGLLSAGMEPDTPAAIIEKGTTASQRTILSSLEDLEKTAKAEKVKMPAVIVIGDVAGLAETFEWRSLLPLSGVRAVVTRPKELSSRLSAMLRDRGAEVIELPTINIVPATDSNDFTQAVVDLTAGRYEWVVFTSPSGVRIFMDKLFELSDIRAMAFCRVACIGKGSQQELLKYGIRADLVPSVYDGAHLGRELSRKLRDGDRVLIPRARIGNQELVDEISSVNGVKVADIATYDTEYRSFDWFDCEETFSDPDTYAVFTSASTVRGFVNGSGLKDHMSVKAVCIGKQTAAEAEKYGMKTYVSEEATLESLADKLTEIGAMYE